MSDMIELISELMFNRSDLMTESLEDTIREIHKDTDEDLRLKCVALHVDFESVNEHSATYQEQTGCTRAQAHKVAIKNALSVRGELGDNVDRALNSKNFHRALVEMGLRVEEAGRKAKCESSQ